jgi:hypothetical protein
MYLVARFYNGLKIGGMRLAHNEYELFDFLDEMRQGLNYYRNNDLELFITRSNSYRVINFEPGQSGKKMTPKALVELFNGR